MFWPHLEKLLALFVIQPDTLPWQHAELEFRWETRQHGSDLVTTWSRLRDHFLLSVCAYVPTAEHKWSEHTDCPWAPPSKCEPETSSRVSHFTSRLAIFF
jgi:hypothetical protein